MQSPRKTAIATIAVVTSMSLILVAGTIDLTNLFDYESQTVPNYIQQDNTTPGNDINNATATLGRVLFYDRNLSSDMTVSCSTCHQQEFGFSDLAVVSQGVNGVTGRHSMRLINSRFSDEERFFWDERADTLEEQVTQPIQDHGEMGFSGTNGDPDFNDLIERMEGTPYYKSLFTMAFGQRLVCSLRWLSSFAASSHSIQNSMRAWPQPTAIPALRFRILLHKKTWVKICSDSRHSSRLLRWVNRRREFELAAGSDVPVAIEVLNWRSIHKAEVAVLSETTASSELLAMRMPLI